MRHAIQRKKDQAREAEKRALREERAAASRALRGGTMERTAEVVVEEEEESLKPAKTGPQEPEEFVETFDQAAALAKVHAVSDPDLGIEAKVDAVERTQAKPGTKAMSAALSKYVSDLAKKGTETDAIPLYDHRRTVARSGARGYLRTTTGGYLAAAAGGARRPTVVFADDVAPAKDRALTASSSMGALDADRLLGYRASRLVVPAPRPRPRGRGDALRLKPRATNATERARRPATSDAVLAEYESVAALRTYAGVALRDRAHPRARRLRGLAAPDGARSAADAWPALEGLPDEPLALLADEPAEPPPGPDDDASETSRPLVALERGATEKAVAWTPRHGARPATTGPAGPTSLWSASSPSRDGLRREAMTPPAAGGWESYAAREARRTPLGGPRPVEPPAYEEDRGAFGRPEPAPVQGLVAEHRGALPAALSLYSGADDKIDAMARRARAEGAAGAAAVIKKPVFGPAVAAARAERKEAKAALRVAADEAKAAWREARTRAVLADAPRDAVEAWGAEADSKDDPEGPMARLAAANELRLQAVVQLEQTYRAEAHERIDAQLRCLPLRLVAGAFAGASADVARGVRGRLRVILGRWLEEFEKAQMTAALGIWRVAVLELRRDETRVEYMRHGGAAKLGKFLARCRQRGVTRCLARWMSRTSWMIFYERFNNTLRLQTCYRRARERSLFVAKHDANPVHAFEPVELAEPRDPEKAIFRLDDRVRNERREMWFAVILIQARQRRNEWRGYYLIALRACTLFQALYKMWPVRIHYQRMRASAVCIESSAHMFLARRPFLRMRVATRTCSRYVRGHLGRCRAFLALEAKRRWIEDRIVAPRTMQRYLRGCCARWAFQDMKDELKRETRAALQLQFAWYRNRGAFATFVLLGCLRVTDEDDKAYDKKVRGWSRGKSAKLIKRRYGEHRGKVTRKAARLAQGAWLRYVSARYIVRLRKEKWGRRKIRCFLVARMKNRHACARKIAFCWWRALPGRFLRHLEHAMSVIEAEETAVELAVQEQAAATIQAVINGQLTRAHLRRQAASIKCQTAIRAWLARVLIFRIKARRKAYFCERVVARPLRDSLLALLNDYRRSLHTWAAPLQARARGWLTRSALKTTEARAHVFAVHAAKIQLAARARGRLRLARRAVATARRARLGAYRTAASAPEVLECVAGAKQRPEKAAEPWLWYDARNPWAGATPQALARRAGRPEAVGVLRERRFASLAHVAESKPRSGKLSRQQEADEASLAEIRDLARAVLGAGGCPDDCQPLDAADKPRAILEACALRFGNLSRRRRENNDASGVELKELPKPCQALIHALETADDAPSDLTRAGLRRFCAKHPDADRALKAVNGGEFQRPPWAPQRAERELDGKRVEEAAKHGRVALERILELLPEADEDGLVGVTAREALLDGARAVALAETRRADAVRARARAEAEAAKFLEQKRLAERLVAQSKADDSPKKGSKKKGAVQRGRRGKPAKKEPAKRGRSRGSKEDAPKEDDASAATANSGGPERTKEARDAAAEKDKELHDDVPDLLRALETTLDPLALAAAPTVASSEKLAALVVAGARFEAALKEIQEYDSAAQKLLNGWRSRHARKIISAARHLRAAARAKAEYLEERRGAAVRRSWAADMAEFRAKQEADARDWYAARERDAAEARVAACLRFGWRGVSVRAGELGGLRTPEERERAIQGLDGGDVLVACYEREKPPKNAHRSRGKRSLPEKFRDDDQSREPDLARVAIRGEPQAPEEWDRLERERVRFEPRYGARDDRGALLWQTRYRARSARKRVAAARKDKTRRAREARERAAWERTQQERLRYVTVRCGLEVHEPDLLHKKSRKERAEEKQAAEGGHDEDEHDGAEASKAAPFEKGDFALAPGLHVVAKFGGVADHLYPGTVLGPSSEEGFWKIEFDDGDGDDRVPREAIKVPKLRAGDRVEATFDLGPEEGGAYFPCSIVGHNQKEDTYRLRFDDGDNKVGALRTTLRVLDADERLAAESRAKAKKRLEQKTAARKQARDAKKRRERETTLGELAQLRRRFVAARAVDDAEGVIKEHRTKAGWARAADVHALALAEMAAAAREAKQLTRPRYLVKIQIEYTRVALRYGWTEREDPSGRSFFVHINGRTTWERPAFDFEDDGAARRVQGAYRAFIARKELERALGSKHIPRLVADVRDAAARAAGWTPGGLPEPPLELWLGRRGFSRHAVLHCGKVAARRAKRATDAQKHVKKTDAEKAREAADALFRARAHVLGRISGIAAASRAREAELAALKRQHEYNKRHNAPTDDSLDVLAKEHGKSTEAEDKQLEACGMRKPEDRRWLREYPEGGEAFLAYWKGPRDHRTLAEVLAEDGPRAYRPVLAEAYRNQKQRSEHMADALGNSRFPVAKAQLDRLLRDFHGRAGAAQEALKERLVDVPTTAVVREERAALRTLAAGARRCRDLIREAGCAGLADRMDAELKDVNGIEKPLEDLPAGSPGAAVQELRAAQLAERDAAEARRRGGEFSGAAARACWLVDDGVLGLALRAWAAATTLQAAARRRAAVRSLLRKLKRRRRACFAAQRAWRCALSRRLAALYRAQQRAPWHMLWDETAGAFYFQHTGTGRVTWDEPDGGPRAFRPQVVDRFSGKHLLAWPQLERPKPLYLQQPREGYCMVCKVEESTRTCDACAAPRFEAVPPKWGGGKFHFCFACFYNHHNTTREMKAHTHTLTRALTAPPLTCCVCGQDATRRCRGLVLPARGAFIVQRFLLRHAVRAAVDGDEDDEALAEKEALLAEKETQWSAAHPAAAAEGPSAEANAEALAGAAKDQEYLAARAAKKAEALAARRAAEEDRLGLVEAAGKAPVEPQADPRALSAAKLRGVLRAAGLPLSLEKAAALHAACAGAMGPEPRDPELAARLAPRRLARYHRELVAALARDAASCADDYCADCWGDAHRRGARAKHAWTGYAAKASVCALCEAAVARKHCVDCGDDLCAACAVGAHRTGKRALHTIDILREPLDDFQLNALNEDWCSCCDYRRAAPEHARTGVEAKACTLCDARLCESCLLFDHDAECAKRGGAKAAAMGLDPDLPTKCVVCGRKPEIRCVQCDEVYCMWQGKPRCFRKQHTKGRRREHEHVPYTLLAAVDTVVDLQVDTRVEAEDRAEAEAEKERRAERQRAAAEFLAECEREKQAEKDRDREMDELAEEVFREQLRAEKQWNRGRVGRFLWDSFVALLPDGRVRRSLSPDPSRRRNPRHDRITAAEVRAMKEKASPAKSPAPR